jgi:hypothetical protein
VERIGAWLVISTRRPLRSKAMSDSLAHRLVTEVEHMDTALRTLAPPPATEGEPDPEVGESFARLESIEEDLSDTLDEFPDIVPPEEPA